MSEKIYEYKDDNDWFVGRWTGTFSFDGFVSLDNDILELQGSLSRLISSGQSNPASSAGNILLLRFSSVLRLLAFVADMINQELGRHLEVRQHQGAVLMIEQERLLLIHLPQSGLPLSALSEGGLPASFGDTILIATRNDGKTKEFSGIFAKLGLKVENLNDYPDLPDVAETGTSFAENALLKAETIAKLTGKMVLADDSGLKVDVLGGLPGVWSARFSGPDADDASNNAKLLHELAMVFDIKDRSAQFHTTLAVAAPGKESLVVEADWPGYIALQPKGENGFGYDPLFLVGETGRTAAELTPAEKNQLSHRALAVKKLMEVFPEWQAKHSL
ncbi:nucleoside-triphosphate diphosphatase [Streptococcus pantholopis]|uniref:dITP/XTP pyrophosphatase n=1 Tax=Streptococcus pantholopis TaxID=1811193 RepID=A0A172Q543_9STRE|nr:nucleoside-triphosphate diphosphatase [Streptococcus pantholopis]AND78566.1 non-canonical purine NTP pyrophosphatase [Streptococcus pantholopis]